MSLLSLKSWICQPNVLEIFNILVTHLQYSEYSSSLSTSQMCTSSRDAICNPKFLNISIWEITVSLKEEKDLMGNNVGFLFLFVFSLQKSDSCYLDTFEMWNQIVGVEVLWSKSVVKRLWMPVNYSGRIKESSLNNNQREELFVTGLQNTAESNEPFFSN